MINHHLSPPFGSDFFFLAPFFPSIVTSRKSKIMGPPSPKPPGFGCQVATCLMLIITSLPNDADGIDTIFFCVAQTPRPITQFRVVSRYFTWYGNIGSGIAT